MIDWDKLRSRRFAAIATAVYPSSGLGDLAVQDEVAEIVSWLCDTRLGSRRFSVDLPDFAKDPSSRRVTEPFAERTTGWDRRVALFLYVTGHGLRDADGKHYLVMSNTDRDRLASTGVGTADLVRMVKETGVEQAVVVIDTCYAQATLDELVRTDFPEPWLILCSAARDQQAQERALSTAIASLVAELCTPQGRRIGFRDDEPYLRVPTFIDELRRRVTDINRAQLVESHWLPTDRPHLCLPNPLYRPETVVPIEDPRRDLAIPMRDLQRYWGPRTLGVRADGDRRWLVSPRRTLVRRLIAAARGEPGTLIITGSAGSGKSAVLGRLVTLSDPRFRSEYRQEMQTVPPELDPGEGAVDLAVVATGKAVVEVLAQMCVAIGVVDPAAGGVDRFLRDEWLERWQRGVADWTERHGRPLTAVVDAVDECLDPQALVEQVLPRIGERSPVRMLIGLRSTLEAEAGRTSGGLVDDAGPSLLDMAAPLSSGEPVHVDAEPWWDVQDMAEYVQNVLLHREESPYRQLSHSALGAVLDAVTTKAGRSFLFAGLAAENLLRRGETVDMPDPGWQEALADGIPGILRDDLRRAVSPADLPRAVTLLRALAFGYGRGVPWRDVWPAIACALDGRVYSDDDIAWLLDSPLSGYVLSDVASGVKVYRVFHDEIRSTLRDGWRSMLGEVTA